MKVTKKTLRQFIIGVVAESHGIFLTTPVDEPTISKCLKAADTIIEFMVDMNVIDNQIEEK